MTFKILIVGGGLSGLTLANGLLKHGSDVDIQVEVYERDAQDLNREGMFKNLYLSLTVQATRFEWVKTV